jgi:hypothetical protein
MEWVSGHPGHFVRREFTVQATLWGRPGLTREVIVMMVPPRANTTAPESAADDFSASKRALE